MRPKKPKTMDLFIRAIEIKQQLDAMKPLYDELDKITMQILESGRTIGETTKATVILVDNFEDKNCVFKPAAIRRFELKIAHKK